MSHIIFEGIYRDRLFDAHGRLVFDSRWKSNMVVMQGRRLLAGFMKNEPNAHGIQSLRVGRGDPAWDAGGGALPDQNTINQLVDNAPFVIPVADLVLEYLDAGDAPSVSPTNRLQITATLGPDEPTPAADPPFPLREFGLFGEFGGAPFMIDYIRHPLIEKDGSVTLERKVRLIF